MTGMDDARRRDGSLTRCPFQWETRGGRYHQNTNGNEIHRLRGKRTACQDQPWILRASELTLADAWDVVVDCRSGDIREREYREEREEEEQKEGLSGRTGLKGVCIYEGLCFEEGGPVEEEQQRLIAGQSQMRSTPSLPRNDRSV